MAFLLNCILVTFIFMSVWVWQLKSKNAGVVDAVWGVIFPIQALVYYVAGANFNLKNTLILCLISFWGLRLGIYLALRNIGKPEDKRYTQIRVEAGVKADQKILSFYLMQVVLALLLFTPVYFIFRNGGDDFVFYDYVGIVILAIAGIGEALADEQLRAFKAILENKGEIMNKGLWGYSRHPNYFFEWLAWVAIAFLALALPWGWLAVISPTVMFYLLTKGTGISMTEATILATKADKYQIYMSSTSAFFPWKKRK